METPTVVSRTKGHGCSITQYAYQSPALGGTRAVFSVIAPPAPAGEGGDGRPPLPALYWLSGLTCTDQNFITKSGAAAHVATAGLLIVAPDTSPRGAGAPGEDDGWDFGTGAGWYLDATAPGFGAYQMETYIVNELPAAVAAALAADDGAGGAGGGVALDPARRSVAGHSMGGHGALTLAARHPGTYASASAFAPVAHPTACPWGVKAFTGYLGKPPAGDGPPPAAWAAHDATELMAARTSPLLPDVEVRVDQGAADEFWAAGQLRGDEYVAACKRVGQAAAFHLHDGYDHSYHFVATFLGDHVKLHAAALGANK